MQVDTPVIIDKLRPYLGETIPLKNLVGHLVGLESMRLELAEACVEAHQTLQEKRRQMLWPKDKDLTELDRKTRLDGDCAPYEKNYEFLSKLEEIVDDRIKLGRQILK